MQKVKILGISGSPRVEANTAKLVGKALEGASRVPGVETELYEMAGKRMAPCTACFRCMDTGACSIKDDFQDFVRRYMEADGVIWGAPVYHMAVPASMKAALDRLGNSYLSKYAKQPGPATRLNKVSGVLTVGLARYGGQDLVLSFMIHSCLLMSGVVVSGDTAGGCHIGAAGWAGIPVPEKMTKAERARSKDIVLRDEQGVAGAVQLGKRVAEMTRIVKAGMTTLQAELPPEYFYERGETPQE